MHLDDQRSVFYTAPRRNPLYRSGGGGGGGGPLQFSREEQRLNQMIESWPTARSFHGRKKDLAADLLRGAMGLQESLIRLGEIEEACRFTARTSREDDCSFTMGGDFNGGMGTRAMGSRRSEARSHQQQLRAARNLRPSRRNCVEELKKLIRDSLHRQNLVSISSDYEKSPSNRSQKLPAWGDEVCKQKHATGSSNCAEAPGQRKARAPNLIARLMGLEEASPEEVQPVRRTERRKNSIRPRPFFDHETPEVGKTPLMEEKPTLQEIKKPMQQLKGSLRSGSIENPQVGSAAGGNVGNFPAGVQVPPAPVIMGPVRSATPEIEQLQRGNAESGHASALEDLQPPALQLPRKVENMAEKAVADAKKAATSHDQKQTKKDAIRTRKKTTGTQKPTIKRSTSEEERSTKPVAMSGSQIKKTSSMPRKPARNPVQVKNGVNSSHGEDRCGSDKSAPRNRTGTAKGRKVTRAKPEREAMTVKQVDAPNSKPENKEIVPAQETGNTDLLPRGTEHQCIASKRGSSEASAFPGGTGRKERETKLSTVIAEARKKPGLDREVLPRRSSHGGHAPSKRLSGESAIPLPAETFHRIKSLLLGSPSFLHRARELFNLHHQQPTHCRRAETEKKVSDNSKLLLDCAGELMMYKHCHSKLANHPMWMSCLRDQVTKKSMNQLVDEISRQIAEIDHSAAAAMVAGASGDGLYTRLERDVKCEGVWAGGAWGHGWRESIPVEEGDGVVCDLEKHILDAIIEEIALHLLG